MRFAPLLLLLPLAACSDDAPQPQTPAGAPGWTAWDPARPEAQQDPRLIDAERARALLFNRLLARLNAALEEGGPVGAMEVCSEVAPALAREVSEELGLRIGRTGVRLRNPANAAPAWAAEGVAEAATRKRAWEHEDGTLGVLTPIQTGAACLVCHGTPEMLGEGVQEALASLYPADQATGFAAGELRGWFWVEAPPPEAD